MIYRFSGICVNDEEEAETVEEDKSSAKNVVEGDNSSAKLGKGSTPLLNSSSSNDLNDDDDEDDDDKWEDMSHDDSATLDGAADEETSMEATKQNDADVDGATRRPVADVEVPDKNNK